MTAAASSRPAPPLWVQVLANDDKESATELAAELVPWLAERVEQVELATDIEGFAAGRQPGAPAPDLVVVLGGDGALLGAVRAFSEAPVPTLGINLGRVGFLASTPASRWRETLESVLAGEGVLEHRLRIQGEWEAEGRTQRCVALNEFSVQRTSHHGMLSAELTVGGTWVTEYRSDGLLVATPSGSTAYSLSAGGPILETSLEALVVTPICPQGLSNRPLVLPSGVELALTVSSSGGQPTLAIDGQEFHGLELGQTVSIRQHPQPVPLLWLRGMDPFRRLRERLGWRGSLDPASGPTTEPAALAAPPA